MALTQNDHSIDMATKFDAILLAHKEFEDQLQTQKKRAEQTQLESAVASTSTLKSTGRTTVSFSAPAPKTPWKYIGKPIDVCKKINCPNTRTKFNDDKKAKWNVQTRLSPEPDYKDCAVQAHLLCERFSMMNCCN